MKNEDMKTTVEDETQIKTFSFTGEVFVLDDGGEVDLDLGNYERFMEVELNSDNNLTTGKIYQHVIEKERRGDYLGKTVQIVPHLTNAIKDWIIRVAQIPVPDTGNPKAQPQTPEICVIEVRGYCFTRFIW